GADGQMGGAGQGGLSRAAIGNEDFRFRTRECESHEWSPAPPSQLDETRRSHGLTDASRRLIRQAQRYPGFELRVLQFDSTPGGFHHQITAFSRYHAAHH